MVIVEVVSFGSRNSVKIEFIESLDIYVKKNYRSKVDSKLFFLNNWKDGVAIYQDIDNYGRSSSFGRMAMTSLLYILSLRSILNLGDVETKI